MNIELQIKKNYILFSEIEALSEKISIYDDNEKNMLFAGFYRNALSHYISINILIEKKLYNSAFALVRILFENIIRAKYLFLIEEDNIKIKAFFEGREWQKCFKINVTQICEKLDEYYESVFYTKIKNDAYTMMNDYTHTGNTQIARNFSKDAIEATFEDELILEVLVNINGMISMLAIVYFEYIGLVQQEITIEELEKFID